MSSIYFERPGGGDRSRAYTYVDFTHARVGNRWCEREWSRFLGATSSLIQKGADREWAARQSPEIEVMINGETFGLMDFGETDFSEEFDEFGATLVMVKSRPGLQITVRTTALHDNPAMVRSVSVTATGEEPVKLERLTAEAIAMEHSGVGVLVRKFSERHASIRVESEEVCALHLDGHGLLFGRLSNGVLDMGSENEGVHAVIYEPNLKLTPFQASPECASFMIPYVGDAVEAAGSYVPDMQRRLATQAKLDEMKRREPGPEPQ